jgi:hypothetical protein
LAEVLIFFKKTTMKNNARTCSEPRQIGEVLAEFFPELFKPQQPVESKQDAQIEEEVTP